eukprot:1622637-Rhodomonas_salina.1
MGSVEHRLGNTRFDTGSRLRNHTKLMQEWDTKLTNSSRILGGLGGLGGNIVWGTKDDLLYLNHLESMAYAQKDKQIVMILKQRVNDAVVD